MDGNIRVAYGRVSKFNFREVVKVILMFIKLSYEILTNKVLCYFKLIDLAVLYSDDIGTVLFSKLNNGISDLITDTDTFHRVKIFIKCDGIVQKELIKFLAAPFVT